MLRAIVPPSSKNLACKQTQTGAAGVFVCFLKDKQTFWPRLDTIVRFNCTLIATTVVVVVVVAAAMGGRLVTVHLCIYFKKAT